MSRQVAILVVDDEPSVRKLLSLALARQGWRIDALESGEEALKKLSSGSYDLVLVDKNLPGLNGVELVRQAREQGIGARVIMITGYASVASALEMAQLEVDAYIEKPFAHIDEIVQIVEESVKKSVERQGKTGKRFERETLSTRDPIEIIVASPVEAEIQWISEELLKELDARDMVVSAVSSREAMDRIDARPPEILIADTALSEPDVFELIRQARERSKETLCLVTTCRLSLTEIKKLIDLGIQGILEKPLEKETLLRNIDRLITELEP